MSRPNVPVALGVAGLVPFVSAVLGTVVLPADVVPVALYTAKVYALVILAFLGGVHWGRALLTGRALGFIWSVVPSLLGFAAAFLPMQAMFASLAASFLIAGVVDIAVFARCGPHWYVKLRIGLTTIVVLSLAWCAVVAGGWVVDPFGVLAVTAEAPSQS